MDLVTVKTADDVELDGALYLPGGRMSRGAEGSTEFASKV